MGSMELRRRRGSAVCSRICADERGKSESLLGEFPSPAAEIDAGEHQLVAACRDKALHLLDNRFERADFATEPRVKGMTQNVQRFPHPSWILRLGRVCAPGASCASSMKE